METSFCAIKQKNIINVVDGKNLGRAQDLLFEEDGCVLGLVVPSTNSSFLGIVKGDSIFIPANSGNVVLSGEFNALLSTL